MVINDGFFVDITDILPLDLQSNLFSSITEVNCQWGKTDARSKKHLYNQR